MLVERFCVTRNNPYGAFAGPILSRILDHISLVDDDNKYISIGLSTICIHLFSDHC